jgi:hypothetical protein
MKPPVLVKPELFPRNQISEFGGLKARVFARTTGQAREPTWLGSGGLKAQVFARTTGQAFMGKHHRIVKKPKLISDFRWTAKRLESHFGEDLSQIFLLRNDVRVSVASLLPQLEEVGFYSLSHYVQILNTKLSQTEVKQAEFIQDLVYKAGLLDWTPETLYSHAKAHFPCPSQGYLCFESGHVHECRHEHSFRYVYDLSNRQLRFLIDSLGTMLSTGNPRPS